MEGTAIGALVGVGFLTIVNVAVVAYTYGKLTQKVKDLCDRMSRVEGIINSQGGK